MISVQSAMYLFMMLSIAAQDVASSIDNNIVTANSLRQYVCFVAEPDRSQRIRIDVNDMDAVTPLNFK